MKVLLSIKPEHVKKIFSGQKKYEFRRSVFKNKKTTHVVVYASSPVRKVVGEFEIVNILHDDVNALWERTHFLAGISEEEFFNYFSDRDKGYAIQIGKTQRYLHPLSVEGKYGLNPPQSFAYLP
jgi:predicted transcriptional regulator